MLAVGVGNRAFDLVREGGELAAQGARLPDHPAGALQLFVAGLLGRGTEPREALEHQLLDIAPDAGRPEVVARPPGRRDRDPRGGEAGRERTVQGEPLERVVVAADGVEQPAQPARVGARVELADLPVVAGGEMRLIGVGVADARKDGDLALAMKLMQRRGRGMPLQPVVLAPGRPRPRRQLQGRAQPAVFVVVDRGEHRERVDAALEEDRDQDLALTARRLGDAVDERPRAQQARAVDAQGEAAGAEQERAPREPGPGRSRHSALDRGQPLAGLGERASRQLSPGELVAAALSVRCRAHEVWKSGLEAISIRNAFCRNAR